MCTGFTFIFLTYTSPVSPGYINVTSFSVYEVDGLSMDNRASVYLAFFLSVSIFKIKAPVCFFVYQSLFHSSTLIFSLLQCLFSFYLSFTFFHLLVCLFVLESESGLLKVTSKELRVSLSMNNLNIKRPLT